MFTRVLALLPFALLATASHLNARTGGECNTGKQQCCNQQITAEQALQDAQLVKHIGLDVITALIGAQVPVGLECSALAVSSCKQAPVCCNNNNFESVVGVYCNSINVA